MAVTPESLDKTLALIAPGQGSQRIGMGMELANALPAAKKVWEDSDQILFPSRGSNFSDLVWHGTMEELTKTQNAQPAIVISTIARKAAWDVAYSDDKPYWKTGHSLGGVIGCYFAEVINIPGLVILSDARGKAQQYAIEHTPPSILMAIQHDNPQTVVEVVNDLKAKFGLEESLLNTYNQVVVGGEVKDIEAAKVYVTEQDRRIGEQLRILPVNGAFHTHFMEPGVPIYAEEVDKVDMQLPTGGLLVGYTTEPLLTVPDIKRALVLQFIHPEDWRGKMKYLVDHGVIRMIELNEAPTYSDMNRRLFNGEREKMVLPNVLDSEGKEITIGWKWNAPSAPQVVDATATEEKEEDPEVLELREKYEALVEGNTTLMEQFLELPAPKTYEGIRLWYCKWTAIRTGKKLEDIDPTGDFVQDAGIDSLDYSVLRADVHGVFGRIVSEEEAEGNVTPVLAAKATYGLLGAAPARTDSNMIK